MLTNKKFIEWANAHVVTLVAHNELGHDPIEQTGYDGETVRNCPLYPGMTCREHCDAAVDIDVAREEGLTKVPFIELCPNSWLVPPAGAPEQIAEEDQFVATKVQAAVEVMQKRLGPSLGVQAYRKIRGLVEQAEAAGDDEEWRKALEALATIETLAPKPPKSLQALIAGRIQTIEESVQYAFEDATTVGVRDATPESERIEAVRDLVRAVDVAVYGRKPAVLEPMRAWLAAQAPATGG